MRCPKCNFSDTKVYDTRTTQSGRKVKRRRECLHCNYRFTTIEEIKAVDLKVEKRSGQIIDFDQEKLEVGIRKAFNKRRVDREKISYLVQKITEDVVGTGKNPIKSVRIGKIVLNNLRQIDEAAYITFAAMFLNFESIEDFQNVLGSN